VNYEAFIIPAAYFLDLLVGDPQIAWHPWEIFNYRDIEEIYKPKILIGKNAISLKSYIVLVSEESKKHLRSWMTQKVNSNLYRRWQRGNYCGLWPCH
jgi:hypothetical protein